MEFEEFKTECKKIIYEADEHINDGEEITTENIKCVELFEDDFLRHYNRGLTPLQAIEEYKASQD